MLWWQDTGEQAAARTLNIPFSLASAQAEGCVAGDAERNFVCRLRARPCNV